MKYLFYKIPETLVNIITGKNLLFLLVGVEITLICVISGFDWKYFLLVRDVRLNQFFFPALLTGGLLPIFLPVLLYVIAKIRRSQTVEFYAYVIAQAAALGWILSSTLKFFTGRIQPSLGNLFNDISYGFNFGFYEHGIFWGWPSSHTTVAFAVSFALIMVLNKKQKLQKYLLFIYALYIGIGVSLSIHWFSDFVAGAILGTIIGLEVGRKFSKLAIAKLAH